MRPDRELLELDLQADSKHTLRSSGTHDYPQLVYRKR